jgi:hypothetical protein
MSDETPSDEELRAVGYEDYKRATGWSSVNDYGNVDFDEGFSRGLDAGRASVTPPTKEAIAEAIWRANAHDVGDDYLAGDSADWLPEADAVLSLFAVPPTESEGK